MAKGKYAQWLEPDKLLLLTGWARDGLTDEQIAHNMGIAYSTLREWRDTYPAISAALKKGKEVVDLEVENALLRLATGIHETVRKPIKVRKIRRDGGRMIEEEVIEYADEDVYIPPNVTAQIYWLKNRRPDKWREKPQQELKDDQRIKIIDDFK